MRIAQYPHAEPIDDQKAVAEIAERNRQQIRAGVRHGLRLDQWERHQRGTAARLRRQLPQMRTSAVHELADQRLRLTVHHERTVLATACLQRIDRINQCIGRIRGRETARLAARDVTELAPRPSSAGRAWRSASLSIRLVCRSSAALMRSTFASSSTSKRLRTSAPRRSSLTDSTSSKVARNSSKPSRGV